MTNDKNIIMTHQYFYYDLLNNFIIMTTTKDITTITGNKDIIIINV
jgi:hypothetical protein